jgi:hypothetical protein
VCVCVEMDKRYFIMYWLVDCIVTEQVLKLKFSIEEDKITN